MRRRLTLTGSTLRPRSVGFKSMIADELEKSVWPFVREGKLRPVMDSRFPLPEAAAAHARMQTGEHIGTIVLLLCCPGYSLHYPGERASRFTPAALRTTDSPTATGFA